MKTDIQAIRQAVQRCHGGFEQASDREILDLWQTISADRRQTMLADEAGGSKPPRAKARGPGPASTPPAEA